MATSDIIANTTQTKQVTDYASDESKELLNLLLLLLLLLLLYYYRSPPPVRQEASKE